MSAGIQASFTRRFAGGEVICAENLCAGAQSGEVTVLFGPSGSGKTTILRCLAGLDSPDEGRIEFNGELWFDSASHYCLVSRHRRVGFVPQDYGLFPHLTVEENIGYGLRKLGRNERRNRVNRMLTWLGLEGLEGRLPGGLSGGQQQRVVLARAVVWAPQLLLLDEPLAALDVPTRRRLRGELRRWLGQLGIPTLLVTHDQAEALSLGSRIVVLGDGRIEQTGPVGEVFNRPATLSVAQVAGIETVVAGKIRERSEGMATVAVGDATLLALLGDVPPGAEAVYVCIRAEDVVLTRDTGGASSARNRIPATVASVHLEAPLTRVELNCGFPLKALITRQALEELKLQPGTRVTAWIKAPHVHLIAC